MIEISPEQLAELEHAVDADPGATCFAVLAEVHRRAGRLAECERVLRQGLDRKPDSRDGRLVLTSVMLDQGREADARDALERLTTEVLSSYGIGVSAAPPSSIDPAASAPTPAASAVMPAVSALTDSEFDAAFEDAETDADELIDPNRVAEEALDHVDRVGGGGGADLVEPGGLFSTESMAELLERQGDASSAARIRAGLGSAEPASRTESPRADATPAKERSRSDLVQTLERWLANLRRESR